MANETTSLFGSLPESQTNDGKIILHTDNGAERSSVALSELVVGWVMYRRWWYTY